MDSDNSDSRRTQLIKEALDLLARMTDEQVNIALAMLSQPTDKAG